MNKNSRGLTAQQIISVQPMSRPSTSIFYFDFTYNITKVAGTKVAGTDMIDLEKAFEQGQTITMHSFEDGDVVHIIDQSGNVIDTGMYFGKKRINNIHHWLILSGKGYRELNTSFHTLIKSEPIEENK